MLKILKLHQHCLTLWVSLRTVVPKCWVLNVPAWNEIFISLQQNEEIRKCKFICIKLDLLNLKNSLLFILRFFLQPSWSTKLFGQWDLKVYNHWVEKSAFISLLLSCSIRRKNELKKKNPNKQPSTIILTNSQASCYCLFRRYWAPYKPSTGTIYALGEDAQGSTWNKNLLESPELGGSLLVCVWVRSFQFLVWASTSCPVLDSIISSI